MSQHYQRLPRRMASSQPWHRPLVWRVKTTPRSSCPLRRRQPPNVKSGIALAKVTLMSLARTRITGIMLRVD